MEREIERYYCLKFIRHNLPKEYKVQSALIRLITAEKTFGEFRDPVIPEFTYEPAVQQFRDEITPFVKDVDFVIGKIKETTQNMTYKKRREEGNLKAYPSSTGKTFVFEYMRMKRGKPSNKPFKIEIPLDICEYLKSKIETGEDFKNAIFMVWIRYINLCNWDDSYQFRISSNLFRLLKTEFDIKIELCASPINSQFPLYGSLFYDTDRHFGSLGTYTDLIHRSDISGMIEINPPYMTKIIEDITKSILEEMAKEDRELGYILFLPFWNESDAFQRIEKSQYIRKSFIPGKMTEDEEKNIFNFYSDQDGKFNFVGQRTCMFVLMNDLIWSKYGNEKLKKIFDFSPKPTGRRF